MTAPETPTFKTAWHLVTPSGKPSKKAAMQRATRIDIVGPVVRKIDGVEVSFDVWVAHKKKEREEARQRHADTLRAEWNAELAPRSITLVGEPKNRTQPCAMRCGCELQHEFTGSLHAVAKLTREPFHCLGCRTARPAARLDEVISERGGELLSPYFNSGKGVRVRCGAGHEFEATPGNLTRTTGGSWCPHCITGGGEDRFREILAERGYRLIDYETGRVKIVEDAEGAAIEIQQTRILRNPPTSGVIRGTRPVTMFYDDDAMTAFCLIDSIPARLPKIIADIVAKGDYIPVGTFTNGENAYEALRAAIVADNEIGDYKVLNVYGNPAWISPGLYEWGSIWKHSPALDGTLVSTVEPVAVITPSDDTPAQYLSEVIAARGGTLLTTYTTARQKVEIRCCEGHQFSTLPYNVTREPGRWCPVCANRNRGRRSNRKVPT